MIDLDFISNTWKYLLAFYVLSVLLSPGLLLNIPPIERPISNGDKKEDKEGKTMKKMKQYGGCLEKTHSYLLWSTHYCL